MTAIFESLFFSQNAHTVSQSDDGNYLISSSHFCMLAMIDGRDGHVMWTLGGKNNDFKDLSGGNATNFAWQHDAQLSGANDIILFDNHEPSTEQCDSNCASRGLRLRLDQEQKTVELVQEFYHPEGVNSGHMGGVQLLKEGHTMVAWGDNPSFVEYNKAGQPVMDVQRGLLGVGFQEGMYAYRVSRHRWQGEPSWPPSVAVDAPSKSTSNATVYVSWNGATDVAQWAIVSDPFQPNIPLRADRGQACFGHGRYSQQLQERHCAGEPHRVRDANHARQRSAAPLHWRRGRLGGGRRHGRLVCVRHAHGKGRHAVERHHDHQPARQGDGGGRRHGRFHLWRVDAVLHLQLLLAAEGAPCACDGSSNL